MFIRKEQVEVNSSDDLMQSLYNLLSFDNDCNGTNGEEYLWEDAKQWFSKSSSNEPYSNLQFLMEKYQDSTLQEEELVQMFLDDFFSRNQLYYQDYDVIILTNNNKVKKIGLLIVEVE